MTSPVVNTDRSCVRHSLDRANLTPTVAAGRAREENGSPGGYQSRVSPSTIHVGVMGVSKRGSTLERWSRSWTILCMTGAGVALTFGLSLLFAAPASADPFQFACPNCTNGSTSFVSPFIKPTFDIVDMGGPISGTAFLAVAVPGNSSGVTVNGITAESFQTWSSGSVFTALAEAGSFSDSNFSTFRSASTQVLTTAPTSYTLYEYDLGKFSGGGEPAISPSPHGTATCRPERLCSGSSRTTL